MSILIEVFPSDKTTKGTVIKKLSELRFIESNNNVFTINSIIDLEGVKISMPRNAEIHFKNGIIKNGTVIFNNNTLSGEVNFMGCNIEGIVKNSVIDMSWFKYNKNNFEDINQYIQELIDLSKGKELLFEKDSYYEISIKENNVLGGNNYAFLLDKKYNNTTINFNGSTIKINPNENNIYSGFILFNTYNITLKNGLFKGEINPELDKEYICEDCGINIINSINTKINNLDFTLFNFKGIKTDLLGEEIYNFKFIPGILDNNGSYIENQSGFVSKDLIKKDWLLNNIEQYKINSKSPDNVDSINWIILPEGMEESYEKKDYKLSFSFYDSENIFIEKREYNLWDGLNFYAWNEFPQNAESFRIALSEYNELPDYSSFKLIINTRLNNNITLDNCKLYEIKNTGISLNYTNNVSIINSKFISIYNGINNETGINLNLIIKNCNFNNLKEGLNLSTLYVYILDSTFNGNSNSDRMIINAIYSINNIMNYLVISNSIFKYTEFNNAGKVEISNSDFTNSVISMGNNGNKYYFRVTKSNMGWWNAVKNPIDDLNLWFELIECSFMRELSPDDYHYDWFRCPYIRIIR